LFYEKRGQTPGAFSKLDVGNSWLFGRRN